MSGAPPSAPGERERAAGGPVEVGDTGGHVHRGGERSVAVAEEEIDPAAATVGIGDVLFAIAVEVPRHQAERRPGVRDVERLRRQRAEGPVTVPGEQVDVGLCARPEEDRPAGDGHDVPVAGVAEVAHGQGLVGLAPGVRAGRDRDLEDP